MITFERYLEFSQRMWENAYPRPCKLCGSREEVKRWHHVKAKDGWESTIVFGFCKCGHNKGPSVPPPKWEWEQREKRRKDRIQKLK